MSTLSSAPGLFDLPITSIDGHTTTLAQYRGKVLLIVNVASKCGLTPQYDALEKLYTRYNTSGLIVLGFPSNDFAGQEPGSNAEIQTFCRNTFNVDFPMFARIAVTGPNADPLYKILTAARPEAVSTSGTAFRDNITSYLATQNLKPTNPPEILWNFEKFLIDRNGALVARFAPDVLPDDPIVIAAIQTALSS